MRLSPTQAASIVVRCLCYPTQRPSSSPLTLNQKDQNDILPQSPVTVRGNDESVVSREELPFLLPLSVDALGQRPCHSALLQVWYLER